ncbi:hypothetical protein Q3V23_23175 [Streptomyces sp. VNUA116]|uniref:hypothetical protein n=1 Tax=Streptomyces sp. VNUA116 TaxID=3062449 RepID=UPI0026773A6C|nr:hypothetical protein [Streptomyces sp. VNUA116]WKU46727.1 hypothetical protein Q3V23_23175 [Streptomyces sp. VNUA116]
MRLAAISIPRPRSPIGEAHREAGIVYRGAGITFVADWEAVDFHITAQPSYSATVMEGTVLPLAKQKGLTLLPDEDLAELMADGSTRIYLVPAADVEVEF